MIDRFGLVARCVLFAAVAFCVSGCSTNPATGRSQALMYNRSEEIQIGEENKGPLTEEFGGAITQPALHNYVADIGKRLAAVTESDFPSLPWEFTLLNSKVINAFALPGGKVFISRGLCEEMTNEAQLAAVLGHEVGHVTARHTSERMSQALGTTIGGAIIGGLIGAAAGGKDGAAAGAAGGATIGGIVSLSFSREQEIEADRLGMRYMEKLGYDPVGAIEVQEILGRAGGGGGTPEFLSTHPASATRIAELNKRYNKYYAHTRGNPNYQKHADRYQPFLAGLRALPKPRADAEPRPRTPEGARAMMLAAAFHAGHAGEAGAFGSLGDPVNWCWHCATASAAERDAE
jgi:predicted Zn-dependent protease